MASVLQSCANLMDCLDRPMAVAHETAQQLRIGRGVDVRGIDGEVANLQHRVNKIGEREPLVDGLRAHPRRARRWRAQRLADRGPKVGYGVETIAAYTVTMIFDVVRGRCVSRR